MKNHTLIAITGGSGSGKTTAAKKLQNILGPEKCKILSQDNYYKDQSIHFKGDGSINFDHPHAIDFELMIKHLQLLQLGKTIHVPIYDFVTHTRKKETNSFTPSKFIIIDGTLILSQEKIRLLSEYSLFLNLSENLRFARRLKRDVEERGRKAEGVQVQFYNFVKPMHDQFVAPSGNYANFTATDDEEVDKVIEFISKKLTSMEQP